MSPCICSSGWCRWFLSALLALAGCSFNVDGDGGGDGDGNGNGGGSTPTTVTISVINNTGATVDPELFVTADALTDPAQLFDLNRKYTRFGVGTRGLLGDFDSDMFTLECSAVRYVGTQGGSFGDDLDNPDGRGQQRILTQDLNFSCGDRITLTFSRSGNTFSTTVTVSR